VVSFSVGQWVMGAYQSFPPVALLVTSVPF